MVEDLRGLKMSGLLRRETQDLYRLGMLSARLSRAQKKGKVIIFFPITWELLKWPKRLSATERENPDGAAPGEASGHGSIKRLTQLI